MKNYDGPFSLSLFQQDASDFLCGLGASNGIAYG